MSEPSSRAPGPGVGQDRGEGYFRNGEWVPREQGADPDPRTPGWRARLSAAFEGRLGERRRWLPVAAVAAGLVLFLVVVAIASSSDERPPDQQRDFLAVVEEGQKAVSDGNDLTLVTASRQRARALCQLLPPERAVQDWIGTIEEVGTVPGGEQGVLRVSIADDVQLATATEVDENRGRTLVPPGSVLYDALADLDTGEKVRFSGQFLPRRGTCIRETSLRPRNGMLTPTFAFRFVSVEGR